MKKTTFGKLAATALLATSTTMTYAADLVVGGKGFTEQLIMASMTEQLLKAKGFDVEKRDGMGSTVVRKAQINGQVDLYWEYTGTSLLNYNKVKEPMDAQQTYDTVKELDAKLGLVWLNPSDANNTYALAVRQDDSRTTNVKTLSELATLLNDGTRLTFATDVEFPVRPDGLKPFQKTYGMKFKRSEIKKMDPGLTYNALREKQVDIALVYTTDGRIAAFEFKVLDDDKGFFPTYAIVPVVREDTLKKYPKLEGIMNELAGKLNNDVLTRLNGQVDVEKRSIESVAAEFLKAEGLL